MVDRASLERCTYVWTDKGALTVTLLTDLSTVKLHDCHKVKGHTGEHECACAKKIAP